MQWLKKINILLFITLAGLFILRCVKPPDYPDRPHIEFIRQSKHVMLQRDLGKDTLAVTFSFTDGDGDIGADADKNNIFIIDGRDNQSRLPYSVPEIDQQGVGNGISGEITLRMPTTCCIYDTLTGIPPCTVGTKAPQKTDTVFFLIYIRDRAGNFSDTIRTEPVELVCKN